MSFSDSGIERGGWALNRLNAVTEEELEEVINWAQKREDDRMAQLLWGKPTNK